MKKLLLLLFGCGLGISLAAQPYPDGEAVARRIQALAKQHPEWVRATSLAKTAGGNDLWVLTLGRGETTKRPALAIVGGVDGRHLLGVELALGLAEGLLRHPDRERLLTENTYYVFPNVNPDATQQSFGPLRYERTLNGRSSDNDRDGRLGEDPYEDLNGDGMITLMRVEAPDGTYLEHPDFPGLLREANAQQGERGRYRVYAEGIDNDHDGRWNEDGPGGVDFNRNFTYLYRPFQPDGGEYPVSEVETRAVADFLYDAQNVHTVLIFSLENNLSFATAAFMTGPTGPLRENTRDSRINALVTNLYHGALPAMQGSPAGSRPSGAELENAAGRFYAWAYQHYGRYAYVTPGWQPGTPRPGVSPFTPPGYLQWAQANREELPLLPWMKVEHPDFPGKQVEVGGLKPHAIYNPPYAKVPALVEAHLDFLVGLTSLAPRLALTELKKETLGNQLSRVTLTLHNAGTMPTLTQVGERSYLQPQICIQLRLASGQNLVQGQLKTIHPVLEGGQSVHYSWLIQGGGPLGVEVLCPTAGPVSGQLAL